MSGSVFLSNLDDFIAPSQACVNPLVSAKLESSADTGSSSANASGKDKRVTLSNDFSKTEFDEVAVQPNLIRTTVGTGGAKKVASVSLNDCLACSGCVTSAETMLIQEQSYEKLLYKLNPITLENTSIVVTISPNSKASIASFLGMNSVECFLRIAAALKSLGVTYVLDASSGGDVALVEAREEFMKRYSEGQKKEWLKPPTTTAISATSINKFQVHANTDDAAIGTPSLQSVAEDVGSPVLQTQLPVLSAHCPGWICYAEKSQPQALPYISTVKSAQQILGAVVKKLLHPSSEETFAKKEVYFVSIQPCFDKKLESSRLDFVHEGTGAEVDLVLSTTELWRLLEEQAGTVAATKRPKLSETITLEEGGEAIDPAGSASVLEYLMSLAPDAHEGVDLIERLGRSFSAAGDAFVAATDSNSGSGGYAEYLFKYAAEKLYQVDLWNGPALQYKEGRNPDLAEIDINTVAPASTAPRKLKFARAYGFRNIQSILMKVRRGNCDIDFIEIMACPSGCNNGGGQVRQSQGAEGSSTEGLRETPSASRERVALVESVFHAHTVLRKPDDSPLVQYLYASERLGAPLSDAARALLHTRYHAVPKLDVIAPLAAKW